MRVGTTGIGCNAGKANDAGCQAAGVGQDVAVAAGVNVGQGVDVGQGVAVSVGAGVGEDVGVGVRLGASVAVAGGSAWALTCFTEGICPLQPATSPVRPKAVKVSVS